jgi:Sputnik virophage major capsid protein 1st domain/Major capsid protein V20 C-terminal domain
MSLNIDKLVPITVNDPRIIQEPRIFPVVKGGQDVLYKQFTTTSVSQSSINFSCPPPSQDVYVDRRVHLACPVRLTLTATGLDPGVFIVNPNQFCLRSYPLQKALDTVQLTINNQSMSVNISDMLSAMEHFNIDRKLKAVDYSKCPTYGACQSQAFSDLFGATRSPMSLYGDGIDDVAPQSFPFTVVSQSNNGAGVGASTATAVIDFVSTEPLFLSPLFWGCFDNDDSAFMGVRTFDMTLNFLAQGANRMIAIDNVSAGVAFTPATWNSSMQFGNFSPAFSYSNNQPLLLFQYLTPQMSDKANYMQRVLNYPYFNIERFPTDLPALAAGASSTASSNNIQLNSIPSKMYAYVRNTNSVMQANPFLPDTFCTINSISIQWGNKNGVLASASQQQLYDLAVKNGFQGSWSAWSGLKLNAPALAAAANGFGTANHQYSGLGSIIALDTLDLGLDELDAPGKLKQLMIQLTVNYTNVSAASMTPTLYFVAISQGIFTLNNGQAYANIGILTSDDILNSRKQTGHMMLSYAEVRRINGGNFLSSIKSGLSNVWNFLKPVLKAVAPALSAVPGPIGQVASALNPAIQGLGYGGAKIPRRKLKNRLK